MKLSFNISNFMKRFAFVLCLLSGLYAQAIQIFSPEPGETVLGTEVLIAASFFGLDDINPESIRLFIDGQDMTSYALIDADMLSYSPSLLPPGKHEIRVFANRISEGSPYTQTWSFEVYGKKRLQDVVQVSGKVTSGFRNEKFGDEELSVGQMGLDLRGTAFDWVRFKTNVKLTTEEDPLLQARNRFGFGITLGRYLELNLGDTYPRLSKFLLDGKRVRGVDVNFKLGVINFHYVLGEINRTIQGGEDVDESYAIEKYALESGEKKIDLSRKGYTFRQEVQGGRLSFGRGDNFQWGFSLLKVRDDMGSVDEMLKKAKIGIKDNTFAASGLDSGDVLSLSELLAMDGQDNFRVQLSDQTDWAGSTPQDNIVLGTDIGFYLDHKRVLIEGELAFSMLNRDIWDGALTKAELDTLLDDSVDNQLAGKMDLDKIPIDPEDFEKWFIINQNMIPLSPIDIGVFDDSIDVTFSEALLGMPSIAMRARTKLNYFGHYFTLEYSQIGPEFNSLGNPFLLQNNRELTISDKIQLFKNRLLVTLIYKHQDDDIATTVTNVTSQNTLTSNITILPGQNLPTLNLSLRLIGRNNGITQFDTLFNEADGTEDYSDNRNDTKTSNVTASVNYRFDAFGFNHNVTGTFVNLNKEDLFDDRNIDTNFVDPGMSSSVFSLSVNTRFPFPLKTSLSITTNSTEFSIAPKFQPKSLATQSFTNLNFNAEYGLFGRKLTAIGGFNYMSGSGQTEINRIGIRGGARISLIENLNANILAEFRNDDTIIANLNLSYSF